MHTPLLPEGGTPLLRRTTPLLRHGRAPCCRTTRRADRRSRGPSMLPTTRIPGREHQGHVCVTLASLSMTSSVLGRCSATPTKSTIPPTATLLKGRASESRGSHRTLAPALFSPTLRFFTTSHLTPSFLLRLWEKSSTSLRASGRQAGTYFARRALSSPTLTCGPSDPSSGEPSSGASEPVPTTACNSSSSHASSTKSATPKPASLSLPPSLTTSTTSVSAPPDLSPTTSASLTSILCTSAVPKSIGAKPATDPQPLRPAEEVGDSRQLSSSWTFRRSSGPTSGY
mmetsp:Transcript_2989/g.9044  ORF Transcript_2989/g.9044 Transcript_2989/m.9044 type:complete len:285 (+) Transcript_2989:1187-2041(+)